MFILRDILPPLQLAFSKTTLGQERSTLFIYTLLAVIVPFTSSMSSNLLRSLSTLFGFPISRKQFYTFMASPCLPWDKLGSIVWNLFPSPLTDRRLVLALDDFINPKVGSKVFGCASIFDHAAKANQSSYPWAQNIVVIGLLKKVKGRWACLLMASLYYLPLKMIEAKSDNAKVIMLKW